MAAHKMLALTRSSGMTLGIAPARPEALAGPAMHVLSYAEHLRGGGVERALLRLAGGWVARGRRVSLVIGDPTGPLAAELPDGVELVDGPLVAAVRRLQPDVVFCPGNHYSSRAAWLRWRLGPACPPIVAKMSNAFARRDLGLVGAWGNRVWLGRHRRFVSSMVAMSDAMAAEAIAATGLPSSLISVIPNPPARALPAATPVALPTGRYVLGVGRLAPQKRWDRLVAALPRLADATVSLVILGEGPERGRLEALALALGVADRLHLPGHAADPIPALAGAAVAALTSDFEGVPGALREALSTGTPVVTTDSSSAIPEIVHSPALGDIVPRDDADALVAALDRWLSPDARRPAPVAPPGDNSAAAYLALFDRVARGRGLAVAA